MAPKTKRCFFKDCTKNCTTDPDTVFFSFPQGKAKEWVAACENECLNNLSVKTLTSKSYYVCDSHFDQSHFRRKLAPYKTKLIPGAIPGPSITAASDKQEGFHVDVNFDSEINHQSSNTVDISSQSGPTLEEINKIYPRTKRGRKKVEKPLLNDNKEVNESIPPHVSHPSFQCIALPENRQQTNVILPNNNVVSYDLPNSEATSSLTNTDDPLQTSNNPLLQTEEYTLCNNEQLLNLDRDTISPKVKKKQNIMKRRLITNSRGVHYALECHPRSRSNKAKGKKATYQRLNIDDIMFSLDGLLPPFLRICLEHQLGRFRRKFHRHSPEMRHLSLSLLATMGRRCYLILKTLLPLPTLTTLKRTIDSPHFNPDLNRFRMKKNNTAQMSMLATLPRIMESSEDNGQYQKRYIQVEHSDDDDDEDEDIDEDEGEEVNEGELHWLDGDLEDDDLDESNEDDDNCTDQEILVQFNYNNIDPNIDIKPNVIKELSQLSPPQETMITEEKNCEPVVNFSMEQDQHLANQLHKLPNPDMPYISQVTTPLQYNPNTVISTPTYYRPLHTNVDTRNTVMPPPDQYSSLVPHSSNTLNYSNHLTNHRPGVRPYQTHYIPDNNRWQHHNQLMKR